MREASWCRVIGRIGTTEDADGCLLLGEKRSFYAQFEFQSFHTAWTQGGLYEAPARAELHSTSIAGNKAISSRLIITKKGENV